MNLQFKQCDERDAERLSILGKKTFIDAFEHLNNPDDFKSYIEEAFSVEQITKELNTPGSRFYFALLQHTLIGYIKLNTGKAQTEPMDDDSLELERIYISKEFQNRGLGNMVLDHVIGLARKESYKSIWLGVWQKNFGAIRFYEKTGFEKFGTHPYYVGKDKQIDWLMKLDLDQDFGGS